MATPSHRNCRPRSLRAWRNCGPELSSMMASQKADEGIAMVRTSIVSVILGCLLSIGLLPAQSYTRLSGLIRDPSDSAVPGATISVGNEETGFRRVTRSRSDASLIVASLEPGLYKITARKVAFLTLVRLVYLP